MKIAAAFRRLASQPLWLVLLAPVLCVVSACSRDTSDAGPRAAAAVAAIALGSDEYKEQRIAALLPVELDYRLPASLAVGRPATLRFIVTTPLMQGALDTAIVELVGLTVTGATHWQIDLAAPRPLEFTVEIVPTAQTPRSLTIAIAAQPGTEGQPRTFHIDFPSTAAEAD